MVYISLWTNLVDRKKYELQGSMCYIGYELRGSWLYILTLQEAKKFLT